MGRTQRGNNAYCQDNELSWLSWDLEPEDEAFLQFVQRVLSLRQDASSPPPSFPGTQHHGKDVKGTSPG